MTEFRGWGGAALVTGASSGIGRELARLFARRGMDLVLSARASSAETLTGLAEQLSSAHGVQALAVTADLSRNEGPAELHDEVASRNVTVDVLVNNAGFGVYGAFANQGPEREAEMVRLNVAAPTELAARFLPAMRERGKGAILNVASTAAFSPIPWLGTYGATKSYLLFWTYALDVELKGTGVRVHVLCPGTTATNFHDVSGVTGNRRARLPEQSAADVAEECLRGLDRGKRVIVTGATNRFQAGLSAFVPRSWATNIARSINRPKSG